MFTSHAVPYIRNHSSRVALSDEMECGAQVFNKLFRYCRFTPFDQSRRPRHIIKGMHTIRKRDSAVTIVDDQYIQTIGGAEPSCSQVQLSVGAHEDNEKAAHLANGK